MTAGAPPPDLGHARAQVLALVAGSALGQDPHLDAAAPLSSLPPQLEAKLAARAGAAAAPAAGSRQRVVGPSASLALLDAIGVVVAAATGHVVLAVLAGVLFVGLAGLTVLGLRYGQDPTRLGPADRLALAGASRWRSKQPWASTTGSSRERGLVVAATRVAGRIAASPAWRSGRLDEQRVRLDLAAELDQIDEQAHRIATARAQAGDVAADPAVDRAWDAAVDRVAALTAYADELDGYARRRREELTRLGDPVRDTELFTGTTQDELAFEQLYALTLFLSARNPADQ